MDQFDGAGGVQRLPASQTASPRGQQREQGRNRLPGESAAWRIACRRRTGSPSTGARICVRRSSMAARQLSTSKPPTRGPDAVAGLARLASQEGLLQKHGRLAAVIRIESHATLTRNRPRRAIGHGNVRIARCAGHLRATAGPTLSATTAPRAPSGFGGPCVVSWAVWCSSSALSSAPISMIVTESQSHVMNTTMAASEP